LLTNQNNGLYFHTCVNELSER